MIQYRVFESEDEFEESEDEQADEIANEEFSDSDSLGDDGDVDPGASGHPDRMCTFFRIKHKMNQLMQHASQECGCS